MKLRMFVLRFALLSAVLTSTALLAHPAYADDVTITLNPSSLMVTEGNTLTLTFTGTNVSTTNSIQVGITSLFLGFPGGTDPSDVPTLIPGSNTCTPGSNLGPGGSCTITVNVLTDNPSGETDADSGSTAGASAYIAYCVFSPTGACVGVNSATLFEASSSPVTITETDLAVPAPEPSSVYLVVSGFAALLGLGLLRPRN